MQSHVGGPAVDRPAPPSESGNVRRPLGSWFVDVLTAGPASWLLTLVGFLWFLPTMGLFVQSLRPAAAISQSGWWTVLWKPFELTIENYQNLLTSPVIVRSFWNTAGITTVTTFLVIFIAALAAYGFACMRFRGQDILFLIVVGLLVVPIQVALIPIAQLYARLGIFGTILGVVIFHLAFGLPFAIFLLRNFFIGIPLELLDAARVDGANHWIMFGRIVAPLAVPALASLSIFQFLWVWNDLLVAMVFAGPEATPLTAAIQQQMRNFGTNVDVIAPGAFLQMLVPLLVFFLAQRYFVEGLMGGAVK